LKEAVLRLLADRKHFQRAAVTAAAWQPVVRQAGEVLANEKRMKARAALSESVAVRARTAYALLAGRLSELRATVRAHEQRRAARAAGDAALDDELREFHEPSLDAASTDSAPLPRRSRANAVAAASSARSSPVRSSSASSSSAAALSMAQSSDAVLAPRRRARRRRLHPSNVADELRRVQQRFAGALTRRFGATATRTSGGALQPLWIRNDEDDRRAARLWHRLVRALTSERAPWAQPSAASTPPRWKLDKTENFSRMRLKLKRDYVATTYAGCAQDTGGGASTLDNNNDDNNSDDNNNASPDAVQLSGIALSAIALVCRTALLFFTTN
jgi:hypothetical protein